ncbi:T9SS outer membrane translocon Sov/SprA [Aurantibacillus circumpalustris]|uniref:T9SS outer membrane translocon Sov/SprA n=1 Tax=Aurantibacillus circumpalustris TaxID=3036359 RepID=UPI00295C272E|nr:cell surface protein SprA [Aurantibacillus circumpalustris]
MRANGLINFVLITSATACLFGVVTKTDSKQTGDFSYLPSKRVLPIDTPDVDDPDSELLYKFKNNNGTPPMLDPKSKLYLEDPQNIKKEVEYDPKSGNYIVKQKIGDQNYRPETYMNLKEYQEYMYRKQMNEYWRSRVAADELNNQPRKGILPKLQVNSELFDRIFGGNTVDIKPTGTAELIFGLNTNKNRNPSIPQKQQSVTNFDFNMRIQLNLIGKIGDKLKITTNYNTEASFDWENQVKVDYTGYEDEIIKKIEAGNVTLPLNSSLISGSQTLFGFKTTLQFGKLTATTVFSQQKGKKQEITVQGGAQTQAFSISADNYEQNKHFYLGHYFRKNYDAWMSTLPIIQTPIIITKVEVYVLSNNGNSEQTRNIVAFEDLGESSENIFHELTDPVGIVPANMALKNTTSETIPSNTVNTLYGILTGAPGGAPGVLSTRSLSEVSVLSGTTLAKNDNDPNLSYMSEGRDYVKIQNARRLNTSEFTFNSRTGYISLNQQLNNDQALAVSYQFTQNGKTYQVGEFSEQVPDNTQLLICKLLKTNAVSVKHPMWRLMMKNVYTLGAYNLNPQDFKLDVYYNNIETGVDMPYLPYGKNINGKQLIRVLQCDKLNVNGDKGSDGVYDFISGYTISQQNGRAYFPTEEPFGRSLIDTTGDASSQGAENKFVMEDFPAANKYIFTELYDSTKTAASFIQNKNRFKIKGTYRSSSGSEIALNALNIPEGAVIVTANGIALQENADYTVDYTLGRVKIINEGILNSGATVKVSLESNSLFSVQQKSLWGTRLDYKAGRNLTLGGTFLRFSERPITQKVTIGDEPVSNIVAGLDFNYKTDAPFLTRLLDKLPFYSTKEMSTISARGEFAKLFPGNAKAISKNGGNSYIDDFEGSVSVIDVKGATSWFLASIPQNIPGVFPESRETYANTLLPGINRARFSWYNVDAMFTRDQGGTTPGYYSSKKLFSNNMWRQVFETELFPGKTPPNGQQVVMQLLDLAYYPSERGPYNYDILPTNFSKGINNDGSLKNPQDRWGGIMRKLETNDFQAANVEYIQFWMMDPFNEDYNKETDPEFDPAKPPSGDLYINLGNISEDIVRDGKMSYENGIPGKSEYSRGLTVESTKLADAPVLAPVVNQFSQDNSDRLLQDVGYDGLNDEKERERFAQAVKDMETGGFNPDAVSTFTSDPSSDRYHFFRGDDYDAENVQANTLKRYSKYNNPEGNSPTEEQYKSQNNAGYSTAYTNASPNIEDINRDNTLNTLENYYQYKVRISPTDVSPLRVGTNFIVDAFDGSADFSGVTKTVKWYQFKIPISQFESNVGGIEGFNSIRFMRVYMKGFARPVLLRLARFELVRSDWRRYQYDLKQPGEYIAHDDNSTAFDVSAVSLQENSTKVPVNYVMPPEIDQQQNVQTTNLVLLNEQSLSMRTCDLKDGDSRAVFKNVDLDTRMFQNIKMNVHAEAMNGIPLNDGDLNLFFRVGTDYNNNFYEYEVPLKLTPKGVYNANNVDSRAQVWLKANEVNFNFDEISLVKQKRNEKYGYFSELNNLTTPFPVDMGGYTITIVGNPNLGTVKSVMVGIRNPRTPDKLAHCAEVWINELRLTDFNNKGGYATTGQIQAKLADLGVVSLAGTYKTPFWGSVESKINERSKETNLNWDVSTSVNAGKFLPDKWKVSLPIFYNYGQTKITPLFNPLDPDVRMAALDDVDGISESLRDSVRNQTIDYTERKGFNVTNFRIDGLKRPKAKPRPWDISNFSATYAFNEIFRRNVNVEYNYIRQYRGNLQYSYSIRNPLTLKPFTKVKLFQNKWFALIKDFSLQLVPNNFGTSIDVNRNYTSLKNRDITGFYAGSDIFENPALINKNFTMTRNYNFVWAFNKSLKFDYTASNDGRILEPPGERLTKANKNTVSKTFFNGLKDVNGRDSVRSFGENVSFRQQMNLNVDVPINKIPLFDFMKINYRFGGTYTWARRPFAANDSIGNTIQNTRSNNFTGQFNMVQLYNKIPYFRRVNNPGSAGGPQLKGVSANLAKADDVSKKPAAPKDSNFKAIGEFLARTVMMLKSISVTGAFQGGQGLPNFLPTSQFGGMDFGPGGNAAPGFLFTTGMYDDKIRERSIENKWLSTYRGQTTPYTETESKTYSYKAIVEPHSSLKIELNGNYSLSKTKSSYILYNPDSLTAKDYIQGYKLNSSPNETGNFNISTLTFFNSFKDGGSLINSKLFDEFRLTRRDVANELGRANDNYQTSVINYTATTATGTVPASYVDGYTDNQQDVLLGAFYRTYTGRNIKNYSTTNIFPTVPLPNWTVSWDGLGKIKQVKKIFTGITLRHAYKSTYSINGFSNNLYFREDGRQIERMPVSQTSGTTSINSNFVPKYTIGSVTMSERYEPLLKFDFRFHNPKWSANLETRRDKTTTLNLTAFQIIETKGQEYIIGGAYTIPKLRLKNLKIQGKVLESSVNIRLDLSFRKNISVIRQVETGLSTPTGGTNIITLRSSADYQLTQNVTLRLFYDWVRTTPQTSASFPTSSTNFGFSLRITFQ